MDQKEKSNNNNKEENKDLSLHDLLIKQQALLLQQSEYIAKEKQRQKEEADEIDLSRLVPGFLKKKKKGSETHERRSVNIDKEMPKNFLGRTILFFEQQIRFLFRNKFVLTAFLVIGLGYGFYVKIFTPKVYESRMTVASGTFANTYYSNLLFTLQNLSEGGSYLGLSDKLGLDTTITQQISLIEYQDFITKEQLQDENDSTIAVINRPFFKIKAQVLDNRILPQLEEAIFNYMKNNAYVNKQIEIRKQALQTSINELKKEVFWFDSLKMAVIQSLREDQTDDNRYRVKETGLAGGGIILSQEDKVQIQSMEPFNKSEEILNKIIAQERELLQLENNFFLVDGFSANYSPVYPTLRHVALYAIYGLILGFVVIYLIQIMRFLYSFKPE